MSVERSFEAWEEVQRHGQDLADRLAQGFTGLIQTHINTPSFPWPSSQNPKLFDLEFPTQSFGKRRDFVGVAAVQSGGNGINGVSAILDIGNRIGQAGAEFRAGLDGMVQQFFRSLPVPFRHEESGVVAVRVDKEKVNNMRVSGKEELGVLVRDNRGVESDSGADGFVDEELAGLNLRSAGLLGRPQVYLFQ